MLHMLLPEENAGMTLFEHIAHLVAICFVIAVVYSCIRKETPAAIAKAAARFFFFMLLIVGGVSASLYLLTLL